MGYTATQRLPRAEVWRPLFLEELAKTANVSEACRRAGISRKGAYLARDSNEGFARGWDAAIEGAADGLEKVAWERATKGVRRPVFRAGTRVGFTREYSNQLLIFLLKGLRPDRYDRTVRVEHAGEVTSPRIIVLQIRDRPPRIIDLETVDVRTLSGDELQALRDLRQQEVIEGEVKALPAPG